MKDPSTNNLDIRIVLTRDGSQPWHLLRQAQWMSQVRREPSCSQNTSFYFDICENKYLELLESWDATDHGASEARAFGRLLASGAKEVSPPRT